MIDPGWIKACAAMALFGLTFVCGAGAYWFFWIAGLANEFGATILVVINGIFGLVFGAMCVFVLVNAFSAFRHCIM